MTIDQFVSMMRRPSFYFGCSCSCSLVGLYMYVISWVRVMVVLLCVVVLLSKMRFLVRFADVDTAMFTCVSVRVNRKFVRCESDVTNGFQIGEC